MLEIKGITIDKLPFEGIELINELLSFEGVPTLLHLRDNLGHDLISYWVDYDNHGTRWLYAKISKEELFDYLIGRKSLRKLFLEVKADYVFLVDRDINDEISAMFLLNSVSIPIKYLPKEESRYSEKLSDFYSAYLYHFNYINQLREKSYIITVEPSSKAHETTVGAKEAAIVLNGFANSIEGYVKVKAFNLLKDKFSDVSRINRRINKVKNRLSPRISETSFHSFEVWLAMDIVTFHGEDEIDTSLRQGLVEGYKQDVLDVDFTNEIDAKIISEKFNEDERKMIYEPLFRVFDSNEFSISISDFAKTVRPNKESVKLKPAFKEIIIPKPTLEQLEEQLTKKNKIISVFLSLKEGEDISNISKRTLLENLIFEENRGESPFEIKSPIEVDGKRINLRKSLRCTLILDEKGDFQLYNTPLDLFSRGTDIHEVSTSLKRQFLSLVENMELLKERDYPKYEELKNLVS